MQTELPAERLQRRLGADSESDVDGDGEPDTSLSRWLPDSTTSGGALYGADLIGLIMARRVTDGEQIIVGIPAAPGQPAVMGSSVGSAPTTAAPTDAPASAGKAPAPGGLVDLNAATVEELDTLP